MKGYMKAIAFLIATALATGIVLFSTRNPVVVIIDLIVLKVETSLSVALLGAGLLGMLAGGFLAAALKRQLPTKEAGMKKLQ